MPRPRTPKQLGDSRDGTGDESDATVDPAASVQQRRTCKRPARPAREGSADHAGSQLGGSRSQSEVEDRSTNATEAERRAHASRHRNVERRPLTEAAQQVPLASSSSAFETPNQAHDRLALMRSESSTGMISETSNGSRAGPSHRSARSTRSNVESQLASSQSVPNGLWRSASMARDLSSQSFSSRYVEEMLSRSPAGSADAHMMLDQRSPQQTHRDPLSTGQITIRTQNIAAPSAYASTTPMARTNSNMSPPRPTRSLPRRRASARTQSRPLLSSSNSASSSYALRSRSTSASNILGPSNSNANILASNQHHRQNSANGCVPLGGGFDPAANPPSGMSTPRTPLAEIPLWLADMRSESRRSSTSSSGFMDREDLLNAPWAASTRHARTTSMSSLSGPSSPGATRNGSTSPVLPFRRSLRGRRPRQSDENARISPSPSYFGEFDALPSPSPSSFRGEMTPLDESMDPNASLTSSMNHLGTSSPSTSLMHSQQQQQQTASPAMSTRSRTLNRAGSVRGRTLTNPLNTPVSVDALGLPYAAVRSQVQEPQSAFHQARSSAQERRTRNSDAQRSGTRLERRAAAAAAAAAVAGATPATSQSTARGSSRPSSRTSSPAHGARSSRRRSTATEGQTSSSMDNSALGPRPGTLSPLQIPATHLARDAGVAMLGAPTLTLAIPEHASEGLTGDAAASYDQPVSPSAFSEMTSLTQGSSTASESMHSANGMPATPSSPGSVLEAFAATAMPDLTSFEGGASSSSRPNDAMNVDTDEASSSRVLRQSTQRKAPSAGTSGQDTLGLQLRPWP